MIADFLLLLLLATMHLVTGLGLLRLLRIELKYGLLLPLALLLGVGIAAFVPFALQLCYVPITGTTVFGTLGLLASLAIATIAFTYNRRIYPPFRFRLSLYEVPFLLVIGLLIFVSIWRCYYLPILPRDMLSGPEAIAAYTVREHTFVNSFFTVDIGDYNNNPFKPLSLTSLQVIYKLAGFPFGAMWLSLIFVSIVVFLYQVLSQKLHPLLAGMLVLLFVIVPDMYGYSYMILYDYSNAVYFFLSIFFLISYFRQGGRRFFLLSVLLMAIAIYFRLETLVLAMLFLPAIILYWKRTHTKMRQLLPLLGVFFVVLCTAAYLPGSFYNNHYLPIHYDISAQINSQPGNLNPLLQRFLDINTNLIFSSFGLQEYGWLIILFLILLIAQLSFKKALSPDARNWIYAILVIYLGLPLLGYLLPLIDLTNTTKRGLFKLFPLILLYLASNPLLIMLSEKISLWEQSEKQVQAVKE